MRRLSTGLTALLLAASPGCYQESEGGESAEQPGLGQMSEIEGLDFTAVARYPGPCTSHIDRHDDGVEDTRGMNTYDERGNLVRKEAMSARSGEWNTTLTCTYDQRGNLLTKVTSIFEGVYTYDDSDNLVTSREANQDTCCCTNDGGQLVWRTVSTTFTHDDLGRVATEEIDDVNHSVFYYEFPDGNVDRTVRYYYDENGNLERKETSGKDNYGTADSVTLYTCDENGNPVCEELDRGADGTVDSVWVYVYDEKGNLLSETLYQGPPDEDTETERHTYTYDEDGNTLTESHGSRTFTYTYDEHGNLLTEEGYTGLTVHNYSCWADWNAGDPSGQGDGGADPDEDAGT